MNHARTSLVGLLCWLLVAAAACTGSRPNETGTGAPPAATPASATTTAGANPRAELAEAMKSQLNARSYRAQMALSGSNGMTGTTQIEFVAPDRFHMTQNSQLPGRGQMRQEFIIVGKETWMRVGDGAWQKFPVDVGQIVAQFRDPKVLDQLTQSADIKYIGADTVAGAPTHIYEYTIKGELGKGIKNTAQTWIGAADNLPRKTETEGEIEVMGKPLKTKTSITYSDYNADIKIAPPV